MVRFCRTNLRKSKLRAKDAPNLISGTFWRRSHMHWVALRFGYPLRFGGPHRPEAGCARAWDRPKGGDIAMKSLLSPDYAALMEHALDITAPAFGVDLIINEEAETLHVSVDGICVLRVCKVPEFDIGHARRRARKTPLTR